MVHSPPMQTIKSKEISNYIIQLLSYASILNSPSQSQLPPFHYPLLIYIHLPSHNGFCLNGFVFSGNISQKTQTTLKGIRILFLFLLSALPLSFLARFIFAIQLLTTTGLFFVTVQISLSHTHTPQNTTFLSLHVNNNIKS